MACEICKKPYVAATDDNCFESDEKPHVCSTCGKSFSLKIQLKRHVLTHANGAPYVCNTCEKKSGVDSKTYNLRLSQKGNFACETCNKCFSTKRLLLRHANEHTLENVAQCDECGESFKNTTTLKKHAVTHKSKRGNLRNSLVKEISGKLHTCSDCGQRFSYLQEFEEHCLTHKTIEWKSYGTKFTSSDVLEKHGESKQDFVHNDDVSNMNTSNVNSNSTEDKKHTCMICNKNFTRKSALEGHMMLHLSDNHESPVEDDSDNDVDFSCSYKGDKSDEQSKRLCLPKLKISRSFSCEKCEKECASEKLLAKHLLSRHGIFQETPSQVQKTYQCRICDDTFNSKEDYKTHKLSHVPKQEDQASLDKEQKTYICDICSKVFLKKKHLKRHVKLHTQIDVHESSSTSSGYIRLCKRRKRSKDFACSVCDKRFAGETCLKKHEAKHAEEDKNSFPDDKLKKGKKAKILICDFCNEDYTGRRHAFVKHKLSHTPEVCGICDARFVDRASLREHCRVHINTEEGRKFLECSQKLFNAKNGIVQPEPKVEYIYLVLR